MRLEIEFFSSEIKKLSFNYNYYITSAIYDLISEHNKDFSQMLHDEGYKVGNKKFKLFVYSRLMPERYSIDKDYMIIHKGITRLYINSPIKEFINSLGNSMMKKGLMRINDQIFKVNNIYLKDDFVFDYGTEFVTLSPIVVTTGIRKDGQVKPRTVHITDSKFIENIKNNLIKKYYLIYGKLPENMSIDIKFDKEYIKRNRRGHLIHFKGITIKGFIIPFVMTCANDIKKVAIDCGLGENNSIGMGYIMGKK